MSLFQFQFYCHAFCFREKYNFCFRTVKSRIKSSHVALVSLSILGTSVKNRTCNERQIRNAVFFLWGGICKFSLQTRCEWVSANLYRLSILRPGVGLILPLLWVMQVSIHCLNLCSGCHQTITPHYLRGQSLKGLKNVRFVACQAIQLSGSTVVI